MVSRAWIVVVMMALSAFVVSPVLALTADIYGYTKAEYVTGSLRVSEVGDNLVLTGFKNVYFHPLEVYVSRGYDLAGGKMIGVLSQGFEGSTTFVPPEKGVSNEDMVFFMVPGWTVPVAVGLFRDEATVYFKPPENQ
jgi:hypothetical protein